MPATFPMTPRPCPRAGLARRSGGRQEDTGILRGELIAEPCREMAGAKMAQIVVEVAKPRPQSQSENAGFASALAETLDAMPAGGVSMGRDVEATTRGAERTGWPDDWASRCGVRPLSPSRAGGKDKPDGVVPTDGQASSCYRQTARCSYLPDSARCVGARDLCIGARGRGGQGRHGLWWSCTIGDPASSCRDGSAGDDRECQAGCRGPKVQGRLPSSGREKAF